MFCVVELSRSRLLPLASVLALSMGIAGCSGESTRFNENPFASQSSDTTGTIPQGHVAPVGRVESQPLPPVGQAPTYGNPSVATNVGMAGGSRGMAAYQPSAAPVSPRPMVARPHLSPDVTGTVASSPRPAGGSWTWEGGKPITVAQGDTVDAISRRYGVPPTAIMHANNITAQAALYPGQHLVIPRYVQTAPSIPPRTRVATAAPLKPVHAPASLPAGTQGVHVVAPGETLSKISRLYRKPIGAIAKANNIRPTAPLKIGDRLTIPGLRASSAKPAASPVVAQARAKVSDAAKEVVTEHHTVSLASSSSEPVPAKDPVKNTVKKVEGTGSLPTFRWPANGRVIASFGTSPNGVQNDGINLALPEGTSVKAAEDGVVAYAGNELKGYGNLILVRHPNGYVTAYAHAKELLVKRGDPIKRGQVIARSGQTGNVNAPQLHFEIRKGASPLDPMRFLKGA